MKYWETIADNLKKCGWSLGWVSAVDTKGRDIFIVDAHRDDGKRYVVRADELLTAFREIGTGDSPVCREFIVVRLSPVFEIILVLLAHEALAFPDCRRGMRSNVESTSARYFF